MRDIDLILQQMTLWRRGDPLRQENSDSRTQWTACNFYSLPYLLLWGSSGGQSRHLGEAGSPSRTTDPCGSCHGSECPSWHTHLTAVSAGGKAAYMDLCIPLECRVGGSESHSAVLVTTLLWECFPLSVNFQMENTPQSRDTAELWKAGLESCHEINTYTTL